MLNDNTAYSALFIIVFSIVPVLLQEFYRLVHYDRLAVQNGCRPPQWAPLKDPCFGLDFILKTIRNSLTGRYLEGTHDRFKSYGSTYVSKHLFHQTIHTSDPENIKYILYTRFKDFKLTRFRVQAMTPFFGSGIFMADGSLWTRSRALIRPFFAFKAQTSAFGILESHFQQLLEVIPMDGSTVDMQKLFSALIMDTATELLFGHSINSLSHKAGADFDRSFAKICLEAVHNMKLGPLQLFRYCPDAIQARRQIWEYIGQLVDQALEASDEGHNANSTDAPYGFLSELAKTTQDRDELRDQLLSMLLASRDTTASLLSNMFFMIARQPHIWDKICAEVASLSGAHPTAHSLKNMIYIRHCIRESLRIHPVIPVNTREAIYDTILPVGGGPDGKFPILVPRGTHIYYSVYSMQRQERFFGPNPEEYIPERWEQINPHWEYLPFNAGPRVCLGKQLAISEVTYITARLAQIFKHIESRDKRPWVEFYGLAVCSKYGTLVSMTPMLS